MKDRQENSVRASVIYTVKFQVSTTGASRKTIDVPGTFININGATYYVANVPFETRLVANLTFPLSAGALEMTSVCSTYNGVAYVGTEQAEMVNVPISFKFGSDDRGKLERMDLVIDAAGGLIEALEAPCASGFFMGDGDFFIYTARVN